jgi:GGDEF domain-containing protein
LLLILSIFHLHLAPVFAETTNGSAQGTATTTDSPQGPGTLSTENLMYNSPQCRNAKEEPDSAEIFAAILQPVSTEIIAKTSTFLLSQANMMRSKGLLQGTDLKSSDPEFQKMKSSCSKYPFQKKIMDKTAANLDSLNTPRASGTTEAIDLQKRYLAATMEANRIYRLLSSATSFRGNEQKELRARWEKIKKTYPMATAQFDDNDSYHIVDQMKDSYSKGVKGNFNPIYSRVTHKNIDDYLFPDASGKFKTVPEDKGPDNQGSPHSAVGFINYLSSSKSALPPSVQKDLSKTLSSGFKPVMEALGQVCQLDPCQTVKINPSLLVDMLNQIPEPGQSKTLKTLCLCEFGKNGKIVPELATATAAIGAIGAAGLCLLSNIGCGAAIVMGIVSSSYAGVNTYDNLRNLTASNHLSSIAAELPTTTAADKAAFAKYENEIYADLALDGAIGVTGAAAGKLAGIALQSQAAKIAATKLRSLFKSGDSSIAAIKHVPMAPAGHQVVSQFGDSAGTAITKSVGADGKLSYNIIIADKVRPLGMDPSGYAVSANSDFVRNIANLDIQSPNKSVIFVDVNYLGKVNYSAKGSAAGDEYLAAVAKTISDQVGNKGTVYRWGGDEFMVVLNSTDPTVIKGTSQAIVTGVDTHSGARALFNDENRMVQDTFQSVKRANSYNDLSPDFIDTLSPAEKTFASTRFSEFKERFDVVTAKRLYESQAMQPSVSIGSSIVGSKTAQEAIAQADAQAARVKTTYKEAMGLDVSKYNGRGTYLPDEMTMRPRDLTVKPVVLDPVN